MKTNDHEPSWLYKRLTESYPYRLTEGGPRLDCANLETYARRAKIPNCFQVGHYSPYAQERNERNEKPQVHELNGSYCNPLQAVSN